MIATKVITTTRKQYAIKLACLLALSARLAVAECIDFAQAPRHIGDTQCVKGKVVNVNQSKSGTWFLNFCEDYRKCPFSAVVFSRYLRDVGDVRQLDGKQIEIHGPIQQYRGQAEIILKSVRQLRGEAAKIPPVPKNFDVQRRGNYSAGSISSPSSGKTSRTTTRRDNRRDPPDEPEPQQQE